MAQAAVSCVIGKLGELMLEEAILISGVHNKVKFMERELSRMQCFLKDADAKQKGDERVRNWVSEVRDIAYDAEDVIDTFILKIQHLKRRGFTGKCRRYICFFSELVARHKVDREIECMKAWIRDISESRSNYGIENLGGSGERMWYTRESLREQRRSSPLVKEPDAIGFDEDVKMLLARLNEPKTPRRVISILGMGGSGKTTLAKIVYHSDDVRRHFDCRAWVYVSQEYKVIELLQEIGKKVGLEKNLAMMNEEDIQEELIEFLRERRYLIVMDDIWGTEVWARVRVALPDAMNGSRILLTTRIKNVALHADPGSPPHELSLLNDDESWHLFSKKAFTVGSVIASCSAEMEKLGRQIVWKCRGLPLAIVELGGLLSTTEKSTNGWLEVLGHVNWQLNQDTRQVSEVLALSYNDLPYYLKSCFLYFSVFPKDLEITARKLVQLWVAEGFIQQCGDKTMEEVGEYYLEELINRSMIQVAQKRSDGGVKTCRIHDLLRDLAISESKEDKFLYIHTDNSFSSLSRSRRLAIHHRTDMCISLSQFTPHLRSLLYYTRDIEPLGMKSLKYLCGGLKLLRVLDLEGVSCSQLPDEIGELIHLRYLGLRRIGLDRLPSSIGNLQNLQTLDIRSHIHRIPNAIWKMKTLRHLYVHPIKIRCHMSADFLTNLQTLSLISAGSWIEDELGKLTNLRKFGVHGALSLYGNALADSIANLKCLHSLRFEAELGDSIPVLPILSRHLHLYKIYLDGCLVKLPDWKNFPPNIIKLSLTLSKLEQDPMATLERLPNLKILRLLRNSFVGKEMICSTGGFPRLELLELGELQELEVIRVEEGAMPRLKRLRTFCCFELKMLPEGLQHVKILQELELREMGGKFDSKFQKNEGKDWYKIQHLPSISIKKLGIDLNTYLALSKKTLIG